MADWDESSPILDRNLAFVLREVRTAAEDRKLPDLLDIKAWHSAIMKELTVPFTEPFVGNFRGERGIETVDVQIGTTYGVPPGEVSSQLGVFWAELNHYIEALDALIPLGTALESLNQAQLEEILYLAGWLHAEWVRIHPFGNGNGRTARLLANY